jgi:hypothetical protein
MTMRTSSKIVTFTRPFMLSGLEGSQPAGTYVVETDEEQLPVSLHTAYRRTATWIVLPAGAARTGTTQVVSVDPDELDSALAKDAPAWGSGTEARVDDLLAGEVMRHAVHSAGLTRGEFKDQLRDLAHRLGRVQDARSG